MRAAHGLLLGVLGLGGGGCSVRDAVATLPGQGVADAGTSSPSACERREPVRWKDASGREVCGARVASRLFTRAMCTCGMWTTSARSTVDVFQRPGETGASVVLNGALVANDALEIRGSLQVGGDTGITLGPTLLRVHDSLRNAGGLGGAVGRVSVGGDAWVVNDVVLDTLEVGGMLTLPVGRRLDVGTPPARVVWGPVGAFPPGCACDAPEDVGASALLHVEDNDNARISLQADDLTGLSGERTQRLDCGRFYVNGVGSEGRLRLVVAGRTALFVGGDVSVEELEIVLEPDAQLDLLIAGSLSVGGAFDLGSALAPAHLRVYVGQDVQLKQPSLGTFAGQLYAPRATMRLDTALELSGALFSGPVDSAGGVFLHYDPAVLELENSCPE